MKPKLLLLLVVLIVLPQSVCAEVYAQTASAGPAAFAGSGQLWLVNRDNRLEANYVPSNMKKHQGLLMHSGLVEPYGQMLEAMKADGLDGMFIQSAYRDYSHQAHIFSKKKSYYLGQGYGDNDAAAFAANTVAPPGASEHQSGLALDVTLDGQLRQAFGETEHGKWLSENCQRFGFIIRYPQDKTEITQIIYEPWHIRYVGVPHAAYMKEKNLCLEEYMDYLAENKRYIYWLENKSSYYLVSCVDTAGEAAAGAAVSSVRPGGGPCYVSTELKELKEFKE